jgi:tRNA-splicing ligase RtcB
MTNFTGHDLLEAGYPQGPTFGKVLGYVNTYCQTYTELEQWVKANKPAPKLQLQKAGYLQINLEGGTLEEDNNYDKVMETMEALMATPTVVDACVMPDAMPAGPIGTIPVGGVVVTKNAIHPGMHSADICCSMMVTEFEGADPAALLSAIHAVTHFGRGGRKDGERFSLSPKLYDDFNSNPFTSSKKFMQQAVEHMGTQGDGNHFSFVGTNNAGNVCLVTHHGSRAPGAMLYTKGMEVAEKMTRSLAEGVLKQNSWIPADTREGEDYWAALQLVRKWTKANHSCLHAAAADVIGAKVSNRLWNEHNFVFQEDDLFYHAKGATPVHDGFLPDTDGVQIVPLNMAQPVLLIEGERNANNLGFAPHGAGRNLSRTAHRKTLDPNLTDEQVFAEETKGIVAISYCGEIDVTELPSAYKDGPKVREQMERMGLAKVVDEIQPYGSIMAGDVDKNAPWRLKREAKIKAKLLGETT